MRPARSATMPKTIPPTADVTSVDGAEQPGGAVVEAEVFLELPDGHHVQQEVHRVEHPPELRGGECAPLLARDAHGTTVPRRVSAVIGFLEKCLEVQRRGEHVQRHRSGVRGHSSRGRSRYKLDPVLVGVGEVDRFAHAVVTRALEGDAGLDHAPDDCRELTPRREPDRDVIEPRRARRRRACRRDCARC